MPKPMGKKVNRIVISDDEDDLHEANPREQLSRGPSRIDSSSDEVEQQAKSLKKQKHRKLHRSDDSINRSKRGGTKIKLTSKRRELSAIQKLRYQGTYYRGRYDGDSEDMDNEEKLEDFMFTINDDEGVTENEGGNFHPQVFRANSANLKANSICEVQPYLYISCYDSSVDEKKLRKIGITHCVDAANNDETFQIPGIKYHFVGIDDDEDVDIKVHFQATSDFVQSAKSSGGKALIYCFAGVSRSATICIMSLVINEGYTLKEAYQNVLAARPVIDPNLGFWRQMIEWEAEHNGGKATVNMVRMGKMRTSVPDVW